MTGMQVTKTPRHLWVVGIVGFLWSSMGARSLVRGGRHGVAVVAQTDRVALGLWLYARSMKSRGVIG